MTVHLDAASASLDELLLGVAIPTGFEDFMIGHSKRRRHSVSALEQAFRETALGCHHIFEIGANDGRHTRRFLADSRAEVHAFEPNPFLYKFLEDIDNSRLRLNTFALGAESSVAERFYIPTSKVTGISSLNVHREFGFDKVVGVSVQTGSAYIEKEQVEGDIAAWIDVEGNADLVLEGFGPRLDAVKVALVEVETHDYYNREPSLRRTLDLIANSALVVVARDWMNRGQFNLLVTHREIPAPPALTSYKEFLRACVADFHRTGEYS